MIHVAAAHPSTDGDVLLRVAVREIREYAYRALVAAGATPGEAAAAAAVAVDAEVQLGSGIAAVLDELLHVPTTTVPMHCSPGDPPRLVDRAGHGPLLRML